MPVPKDLQTQISQAVEDIKTRQKQEQHDADEKRAKEEEATAKKLYNDVRSELGLPPLPEPKQQSK